jgi:hypothetical protein
MEGCAGTGIGLRLGSVLSQFRVDRNFCIYTYVYLLTIVLNTCRTHALWFLRTVPMDRLALRAWPQRVLFLMRHRTLHPHLIPNHRTVLSASLRCTSESPISMLGKAN